MEVVTLMIDLITIKSDLAFRGVIQFCVIEKTMLVSFDIRFIRGEKKPLRNEKACPDSQCVFLSRLINLMTVNMFFVKPDKLDIKRH